MMPKMKTKSGAKKRFKLTGSGKVKRWTREIGRTDDPLLFMESMSAPETRLYVQKVMANLWIYRDRLNQPSPSLDELASGEWPIYRSQPDMQIETKNMKNVSVKMTADVFN